MGEVYFISGHIDLSEQDFITHYKPLLDKAIEEKAMFIVGDAAGTDTMAQKYLSEYKERVLIFHMFDKVRNNVGGFKTIGGFKDDESRDKAMTLRSTKNILYIRSEGRSKKLYGKKYKKRID
jgi:hypothetical protein